MSYDPFVVLPVSYVLALELEAKMSELWALGVIANIESTQHGATFSYRLAPRIYRPMMEKEKP